MKCASCSFEMAAGSRFCARCGSPCKQVTRCEGCGKVLPAESRFCPGCGYHLGQTPLVLATEAVENDLYRRTRKAFYQRFVERIERKNAQSSLYGVVRLLARRPIELDMAASLNDLARLLTEIAQPYVASLRTREVLLELSTFLAPETEAAQPALAKLDRLTRQVAAECLDYNLGPDPGRSSVSCPTLPRIWPGLGTCFGPAIDPSRMVGNLSADCEILLHELNQSFLEFVGAYDRLWPLLFSFVERYIAGKCSFYWHRFAHFDFDFQRYSSCILDAKKKADEGQLEQALEAVQAARTARPEEPLAPLLAGLLFYLMNRRREALDAFAQVDTLEPSFVCLVSERLYWGGRCLLEEGRLGESIAAFEALIALPKNQVEKRYYLEGEFLLARSYLLKQDIPNGVRRLESALRDGFTEVADLFNDTELQPVLSADPVRSTLQSRSFLQALSRQAGVHPQASTYLSATAAPVLLASAPDSWLHFEANEVLVFFYDASRSGSGRSGLCLTNHRLTWKEETGNATSVLLSKLHSVQFTPGELVLNDKLKLSTVVFHRLDSLHCLLTMMPRIFRKPPERIGAAVPLD